MTHLETFAPAVLWLALGAVLYAWKKWGKR